MARIAEQRQIAAFLDDELSKASEIRANIESQIATLTAYRKSLIHECVTGQRRVTEADVRRAGVATDLPTDARLAGGANP